MPAQSFSEFVDDYLGIGKDTYKIVKQEGDKIWKGVLERKYKEGVLLWGIGSGKCMGKGTKVLMYSGKLKKVENIKTGELLMGEDSKPKRVLSLSRGKEELYRITPYSGSESFIVNKSHILSLKRVKKRSKKEERNRHFDRLSGSLVNISVGEYIRKSRTFKHLHKLWKTRVEFREQDINIDPYFLGVWLGDGNSSTIGITTRDNEIVGESYRQAAKYKLGITINQNKSKTCPTYIITSQTKKGAINRNILLEKFKEYNLIKNKHIPIEYKANSRKIRLELLAGLIDTDGNKGNNHLNFANSNKILAEDVAFLARSLGLKAKLSKRFTKCRGKRFKSYRVYISGNCNIIPVRLKRKKCIYKKRYNKLNSGFEIDSIGIGNYYGFELDGNGLYLLSDFTVTHNSFMSEILACLFVHRLLCFKSAHEYFRMTDDKPIAVVNMGTNATQAKNVIFTGIRRLMNNCEFFQRFSPEVLQTEIRFEKKNISLYCGNSKETMPIGMNVICMILDEASWYLDNENRSIAEDIYSVGKNRIVSRFGDRGFIIPISAPRHEGDFITRLYKTGKEKESVYTSNYKTWEVKDRDKMKPETFDFVVSRDPVSGQPVETWKEIPTDFKDSFDSNPEKAMRDFGARPSLSLEGFYKNPDAIESAINQNRTPPINEFNQFKEGFKSPDQDPRFIHIDLGLNREGGDACGLACGKFDSYVKIGSEEKVKLYYDLILQIKALPKEEIKFESVRQIIYQLKDLGFNIELVTYDGFQSIDSIQILQSKGIKSEIISVDKTTEAHDALKSAIYEKRIDIYKHDILIKELKSLELVKGNKVDHAPRSSKDVADACAGVAYNITKKYVQEKREYGRDFGTVFA